MSHCTIAAGFTVPTGGVSLAAYGLYAVAAGGATLGFMSAVHSWGDITASI